MSGRWTQKTAAYLAALPWAGLGRQGVPEELRQALNGADWEQAQRAAAEVLPSAADWKTYWQKPLQVQVLSGKREENLKPLASAASLGDALLAAALELLAAYKDEKTRFLALWRLLPARWQQRLPEDLKPYGAFLPADPQQPDAAAWEQAELAVATVLNETGAAELEVLLFHFGSVQDYVFTARRTTDFWAGSYWQSYAAWQALRAIAEEWGPQCVVFPRLSGQVLPDRWLDSLGVALPSLAQGDASRVATFPNVATVILPAGEGARAAQRMEEALRQGRRAFMEEAAQKAAAEWPQAAAAESWKAIWRRQQEDFIAEPCQWAVAPWKKQKAASFPQAYGAAARRAARLLGAAKQVRPFDQSREEGCRCSLCAKREALRQQAPAGRAQESRVREEWKKKNKKARGLRIRQGERLCAVCLAKRMGAAVWNKEETGLREGAMFPSTATLAVTPFWEALLQRLDEAEVFRAAQEFNGAAAELKPFAAAVGGTEAVPRLVKKAASLELQAQRELAQQLIRIEGSLLYEESLDRAVFCREWSQAENNEYLQEKLAQARKAQKQLLRVMARGALGVKPQRYYAVLFMDGDKMGRWVSGSNAPDLKDCLLQPASASDNAKRPLDFYFHRALGEALAAFALQEVPQAVEEECRGRVVYAGGDDVLALLPVEDALQAAQLVEKAYCGEWSDRGAERLRLPGEKASISAGIVVAHHSRPLLTVLGDAAETLDEEAKEKAGRAAWALRLDKRAGGLLGTAEKWRLGKGAEGFCSVELLQEFCGYWKKGLSPALAYRMLQEMDAFCNLWEPDELLLALQLRLDWLVERHSENMGEEKEEEAKKVRLSLRRYLYLAKGKDSDSILQQWRKLTQLLLCSLFLVRGDEV